MENKLTAIQALAIMIEDRIGVSTMADQNKEAIIGYQMALVGIKLELKKLLELEREQIEDAYNYGYLDYQILAHDDAVQYYDVNYGKPTPKPFA